MKKEGQEEKEKKERSSSSLYWQSISINFENESQFGPGRDQVSIADIPLIHLSVA